MNASQALDRPREEPEVPPRRLTKEEVAQQLDKRSASINLRLDALQGEVATAGEAVREAVFRNPLLSVGGMLVAGLVVGLIVGKRRDRLGETHAALLERYLDVVGEEVRRAVRRGRDADEAVREALQGRAPVIVYEAPERSEGFIKQSLDLVLKTAMGFAVKAALDTASNRFHFISDEEEEEAVSNAVPVAAAISESPGSMTS